MAGAAGSIYAMARIVYLQIKRVALGIYQKRKQRPLHAPRAVYMNLKPVAVFTSLGPEPASPATAMIHSVRYLLLWSFANELSFSLSH
jgi:hypothetical protein